MVEPPLQVPRVVAEAKEALAKGMCVVIGLQTTGARRGGVCVSHTCVHLWLLACSPQVCRALACAASAPAAGQETVQETGDRRQETGDRGQGTGDRG